MPVLVEPSLGAAGPGTPKSPKYVLLSVIEILHYLPYQGMFKDMQGLYHEHYLYTLGPKVCIIHILRALGLERGAGAPHHQHDRRVLPGLLPPASAISKLNPKSRSLGF